MEWLFWRGQVHSSHLLAGKTTLSSLNPCSLSDGSQQLHVGCLIGRFFVIISWVILAGDRTQWAGCNPGAPCHWPVTGSISWGRWGFVA